VIEQFSSCPCSFQTRTCSAPSFLEQVASCIDSFSSCIQQFRLEIDSYSLVFNHFIHGTWSILANIVRMFLVNGLIHVEICSMQTCIEPLQVELCSMQTCIEQFPDGNGSIPTGICSMNEETDQAREIPVSRRASAGPVLADDASFLAGNVSRRAEESASLALPGRFLGRERSVRQDQAALARARTTLARAGAAFAGPGGPRRSAIVLSPV
jgi:hypothetical protein